MRHIQFLRTRKAGSVILPMVAVLSMALSSAFAQQQTLRGHDNDPRAGVKQPATHQTWERYLGGVSKEQRINQAMLMGAELTAEMPNKAMDAPVRIDLSDQDRADLAAQPDGPAPLRIGVVKSITPVVHVQNGVFDARGESAAKADGSMIWSISFESPDAKAIRLHVTNFSLPVGAELYFYSPNSYADGPYTGKGRNGNGEFWTRSISSGVGVIQVRYAGDPKDISFDITEIAHIHDRDHLNAMYGSVADHDSWPCSDNVSCLVDANCVSGTPADPAKDAIAKMEWITSPYVNTCTGGLLNDTDGSTQIPYFLTANHCTSTSISNLETWFNYTTDSCNGVCPHNIITGGAPPSDTTGYTVIASSSTSDFCFGTLDESPPAGAVFLGWNSTPIAFTNGTQLYRISNANFGPQVYSQQQVDTSSVTCSGLSRGNIIYSHTNTGGTMGGSSGSPVVNSSGEVVGQLYGCCGYNCADECDSANNWTVDGAFAVTFSSIQDYLDPPSSGCTSNGECDDGLYCNGAETCNLSTGNCQSGTAPNCNDGVSCTVDSCNEGTDSCDNIPNNGLCDDGQYCNGTETCNAALGCQSGTAPNCDDGVGCTMDSCNEGTDSCDNIPSNGLCDDGLYCNGTETCNATLDCQSGTAPNCNDGVGCTDDSCNETTDSCDNVANNANCDDGLFCNGAETCSATLDCQAGSDPCPGQICDEGSDTCVGCNGDPDCDDGVYCNGAETCVGGTCQAGTTVNCDDGVGCTDDSCNEGTDSCDNVPNDANCDNGLFCDGAETCNATLDCQAGTAVNCDDSVGCTADSCNETTDSCDNIGNDALCDDGVFCNGAETCNVNLDCQSGAPPSCDDGVGCTDDSCNSGTDSCDNIPNNANCDDGQFCNGAEICNATLDCQAGSDPCPGQACDEGTDTCQSVECVDAGDCDDGNACTTDSCVGNVCVNDCPDMISTYPYAENFDSGLAGWTNVGGDVFDWTLDANGTPSSNTGPSGDHTTGSGNYVYIETSSPRVQGDNAILESPCIDLTSSSSADLSFWYHMYGSTIGTLDVEVSNDCTNWTNVWSLSGNQGNTWFQASVNLDAFTGSVVRVRFIGTRGSSYTGDIAIDDVGLDASGNPCTTQAECDDGDACTIDACVGNICQNTPLNCDDGSDCTIDTCSGGVCSSSCAATVSSFPDTEDYEAGQGDWTNVGGDDFDWARNSGGTPSSGTGPSGDHTTGSGWYMYVEASSPNYPSMTTVLEGPCVDLTGSSSANITFWYHMLGSNVGTLYLEASDDCSTWSTQWSLSGNQGSSWLQANVDLSSWAGSIVTLRFRGVTGSSYQGDMCIDDLVIDAGGPQCSVPADCDDGLYCNGAEDCVSGSCVAGTPPNCSDGVGCTDDTCNEGTDSCDHTPNNGNCDDGLFCNGSETCDSVNDCQAGTAPNCNDGVACTDDSCNEGTDSCDNVPNNAACDNGLFCDGAETCNPATGCQGGTAPNCDDGVGCTDDSCNEGTDSCDNVANDANCPDDGLFCNGSEYCNAATDCSSSGDPCAGGEICNESTDTCEPGSAAKMEAGSVTVGSSAVTVNLVNSYASPVIVCTVNYNNNSIPVVTRVGSVTSNSFDVWLQNAGSGTVQADVVTYLVVEEGTWTVDGVNIEAHTYLSTVTDENNSWVGQAQSYAQAYTNPVVLGQVMSDNDPDWSVFWDQGNSRTNPPSATSLRTGKTVCEDTVVSRANETIGFIVIEAGTGTINGVEYAAALGADTILGVGNAPPYAYNFESAFSSTPQIAVVSMAAMDGANGGWAVVYGSSPLSTTQLNLAIAEDTIGDSEQNHVNEQVGYIVFGTALSYP